MTKFKEENKKDRYQNITFLEANIRHRKELS